MYPEFAQKRMASSLENMASLTVHITFYMSTKYMLETSLILNYPHEKMQTSAQTIL